MEKQKSIESFKSLDNKNITSDIRVRPSSSASNKSVSWINSPKIDEKIIKKQVIHQMFEKCINYTTDCFWINLFANAARGKFSKGFKYFDEALTYTFNKKESSIYMRNITDEQEFYMICYNFFREKGSIRSEKDIENDIIEMNKECKNNERTNKKYLLYKKINEYVLNVTHKNNFTDEEKSMLLTTINCCLYLKIFSESNIIYDKNENITKINGLTFEGKKYSINRIKTNLLPLLNQNNNTRKKNVLECDKRWEKIIESLGKNTSFETISMISDV